MRATIDMVPMTRNGEIVYADARSVPSLGAVTVSQNFVNTASSVQNLATAAAAVVPTKPVSIQSDFSKVANVVATGAATVAAVAAVVPVIGTVVAVVAGVVAAAAALLGKIFFNSKAKQYEQERQQWELVNSQIKYENQQLDNQYLVTRQAIDDLKSRIAMIGGQGVSGLSGGLGVCIIGCKKKEEKAKLMSAQDENKVLVEEQKAKTTAMASLLDEYNKLIKGLLELSQNKSTNEWIAWILGGTAVLLTGYLVVKKKN